MVKLEVATAQSKGAAMVFRVAASQFPAEGVVLTEAQTSIVDLLSLLPGNDNMRWRVDICLWPSHHLQHDQCRIIVSAEDEAENVLVHVDKVRIELVTDAWVPQSGGRFFNEWARSDGSCHHRRAQQCWLGDSETSGWSCEANINVPFLRQTGHLHDDKLHLCVSVWLQAQEQIASPFSIALGNFTHSDNFSDMVIVSAGREFRVHRSVLAAQSPVLKKMICAGMVEGISGRLEVADMDANTTEAFLQYLYTGSCHNVCRADGITEGLWYHVVDFDFWSPSCCDLTMTQAHIDGLKFSKVSFNGTSLHIVLESDKVDYTMELQGPGVWEDVNSNDKEIVVFKEGALLWSCEDGASLLHCKNGELQFARCWGELLCAADKYCVTGLAELCGKRMVERLSIWSAATMLQYACSANQEGLKRDIMYFITLTDDMFRSVKDMPEFDSLHSDLHAELTDVLLERRRPRSTKREANQQEFPDGQDWSRLSRAQLRRACVERCLPTGGGREVMMALLQAQENHSSTT